MRFVNVFVVIVKQLLCHMRTVFLQINLHNHAIGSEYYTVRCSVDYDLIDLSAMARLYCPYMTYADDTRLIRKGYSSDGTCVIRIRFLFFVFFFIYQITKMYSNPTLEEEIK